MCNGGGSGLEWLWQALLSGVAIAAVLAILGWFQRRWQQREQIAHLRQFLESAYREMLACSADRPEIVGNMRMTIFQRTQWMLDVILLHRTPDLHYAKLGAVREVHMGVEDSTARL